MDLKLGSEGSETMQITSFVYIDVCSYSLFLFTSVFYFRLNISFYSLSYHCRIGLFPLKKQGGFEQVQKHFSKV